MTTEPLDDLFNGTLALMLRTAWERGRMGQPPRFRYRIELLAGERVVKSVRVRGYRPTAHREAERICSWDKSVDAYQFRRIRDDKVFDRTEVRR